MSNYMYDNEEAVYAIRSPSDTRRGKFYTVSYDHSDGSYFCECPNFQFNAPKTCKHIDREWQDLYDYAEEKEEERPSDAPQVEAPLPASHTVYINGRSAVLQAEALPSVSYSVSMNGNEPRVLERPVVDWLLDALSAGDEITVSRA